LVNLEGRRDHQDSENGLSSLGVEASEKLKREATILNSGERKVTPSRKIGTGIEWEKKLEHCQEFDRGEHG